MEDEGMTKFNRNDEERTVNDFEHQTNNIKIPMSNWTRVIIETDEKNPKLLAVVTNDDCETAEGLRVRLMPSKEN